MGPKRLDDKCDATVTSDDSKQEQQPLVVVQTVAHSLIVHTSECHCQMPKLLCWRRVEGTRKRHHHHHHTAFRMPRQYIKIYRTLWLVVFSGARVLSQQPTQNRHLWNLGQELSYL
jgi:hypothetical protein